MTIRVTRQALLGATLLGVMALPGAALADWTESIQDQRCDPEVSQGISEAVRESIEASVRRAEAAVLPPTAVGDLGCLNDLMTAPLAMFSQMGGTLGSLQVGLGNFSPASIGLDIDISGMICRAAAEKWAELTEPLSVLPASFNDFASMAAKAPDRIASGDFSFIPGISGNKSTTDRNGYSGSITDYVMPSTIVSDPTVSRPIFPSYDDPSTTEYDGSAMADAEAAYTENMVKEFADYLACRLSYNDSNFNNSCHFNAATPPQWSFSAPPPPAPASTPAPSSTGERPYGTTAGSGGAAAPAQTAPAATGPAAIWNSLGVAGN